MRKTVPWVDGKTEIFGVIAHPIDHVRAPMVFNPIFSERCLPKLMIPIDVMPENLEAVITGLKKQRNFRGLAVTIPHKVEMAKLCDQLGKVAELTGAVNAVRFNSDGTMFGDNFDGAGFVEGCRQNGIDVVAREYLLLVGGAARAL